MKAFQRFAAVALVAGLSCVAAAADFSAWPMKMKITFSGYDRTEALTDFPALVVFTNNLAGHFRYVEMASPADAGDLRFSAADGTTELSYEVDTWNPDGTSYVWVRLPQLASSNDFVYAYWGNGDETTPPAYTANGDAWGADYKAVWHLGGAGGTRPDATTNGFTGTLDATGVAASDAGKIGGADLFTGPNTAYPSSGGITCGNVSVTGAQTIEMWVNAANLSARRNPINKAYGGEGTFIFETDGRSAFYHGTSGGDASPYQTHVSPVGTIKTSQWIHLAHVRDQADPWLLRWYVNGQQVSAIPTAYTNTVKASTRALTLGKGYSSCFNGLLDEVRVSTAAYSSNRIWACWANTVDPLAFQTATPLESSLPLVTIEPVADIAATSAWLGGALVSTGSSDTAVSLYWGTSSGGTEPAAWTYSNTWAAPQTPGALGFSASNLTADDTWYYRWSATNDAGIVWSRVENFITGELTISVASNAFEQTLTPGAFTVARPATATNEPLTVAYAVMDSSAQPGVDYVPLSGSVTIPAGEASAAIPVVPLKNYALSADTTVQVFLTGAAAILGAASNATLTIVNEIMMGDVYVSKNGDNSDGTTWATAYNDVQSALNRVAANGTIHIAGGQTFESAAGCVWPAFANVTIRGGYEAVAGVEPGANDPVRWPTILQPTSGAAVRVLTMAGVAGATLENLTFQNGNVSGLPAYGGAVYANAVSGLAVRNCRFIRNKAIGSNGYGGGFAAVASSGLVTNSVFLANVASTTTGHGTDSRGGAIYLNGGPWVVRDVQCSGNYSAASYGGYRASGYDMAGGIYFTGSGSTLFAKNLLIVNCDGGGIRVDSGAATLENLTVSGCDPNGITIGSSAAAGTTIRNSISYGSRDDFAGSLPKLHYNIIGDGTGAGANGNLADDPLFAFPLFYLADGSPALNSGTGTVEQATLAGTTVRVDGALDSGTVSRGYHFTSGVVWDSVLHVAPGGTGNGATPASPLGSITAALAQGGPRTQIHLAAGTYTKTTETFPLPFAGRIVQLLGTNAAATVIDATGSSKRAVEFALNPFGDNRVSDVTICGGNFAGNGGLLFDVTTLTLDRAIIRDNRSSAGSGHLGGGVFVQDSTLLIQNSEFRANTAQNSTGHIQSNGGGLAAFSAVTMRLLNTAFLDNQVNPAAAVSLYNGGGVWLGSGHFLLRNLLLAGNRGGGVYVSVGTTVGPNNSPGYSTLENLTATTNNAVGVQVHSAAAPRCKIRNTISYGNNVVDFSGTVPAVFEYNSFGGGTQAGVNGNITGDPLFVDPLNRDFRLSAGSPCENQGLNQGWMALATDLAGNPRIRCARVEMGAYEIVPPLGTMVIIR